MELSGTATKFQATVAGQSRVLGKQYNVSSTYTMLGNRTPAMGLTALGEAASNGHLVGRDWSLRARVCVVGSLY
jgi:hypothetical protein